MAYTKTPEIATHGVDRLETQGDSFNTSYSSAFPPTLKYTNCFIEKYHQTADQPKYRVRKREYYDTDNETYATVNSQDRLSNWSLVCSTNNKIVFARDSKLYFIDTTNNTITFPPANESNIYISAATTALSASGIEYLYVLIDGSAIVEADVYGLTSSVTSVLSAGTLNPILGFVYMNGYLFGASNTGRIYNSDPAAQYLTWNDTNYISPEIFTDGINFIAKHHNHVVAVGNRSTEFFYDAQTEIGSPLERQETYTQAVGCYPFLTSYSRRFAQIGDDIYFPGVVSNGGISIYRIRNFKVEQVATPYVIDRINYGLADGTFSPMQAIKIIQIMGKPHVLLEMNGTEHLVLNPESGNWWSLSEGEFSPSHMIGDMFTIAGQAVSPCRFIYHGDGTSNIYLGTPTKYQSGSVSASISSDIWDHGSNVQKQVKWLDSIGSYGNNTLSLTWYKDPSYTNTGTTFTIPASTEQLNSYRWRNLGRCRRAAFKIDFVGTSDISHEAVEISYNLGTW